MDDERGVYGILGCGDVAGGGRRLSWAGLGGWPAMAEKKSQSLLKD